MERFYLVPVDVSVLDLRSHFRHTDFSSPVSDEELHRLIALSYKFVPTAKALEAYGESLVGKPAVN